MIVIGTGGCHDTEIRLLHLLTSYNALLGNKVKN